MFRNFAHNDGTVPMPNRRMSLESFQDSGIADMIDSGGVAVSQPPANHCHAFRHKEGAGVLRTYLVA